MIAAELAFPAKVSVNRDTGELMPHQFGNNDFCTPGMTLRDYFAAKAMQALITSRHNDYERGNYDEDVVALNAYMMADAMITEREGT